MNYKVKRIGLINFWLYDEEEFDFEDGNLLLRGTNGSGKSVTMQSFIPLILDGNKNPSRLDPFGSKDKRIEDYLLGSADSEQKDEATGYLYMELYNAEKQKYLTLGIGLRAKKGRPTEFWGFIIRDGKRIGRDILLYHSLAEKIPCTKKELRARLGSDNIFVETAKDYKEAVNKNVFGFPNLDMYDEFINLLLQLRSPKLSKEYKPVKLMEILSGVLQPLTEEDLRPLSEAIEEMDKTKEKTLKLQDDVKQLSNLLITYNNYNETMLYKKAENYLNSLNIEEKEAKEIEALKIAIQAIEDLLTENQKKATDLELQSENFQLERANLDSHDLDSKALRLNSLTEEIKSEQVRKKEINNNLNNNLDKLKSLEENLKDITNAKDKKELECLSTYKDVIDLCEVVKFTETSSILKDYLHNSNILKQFGTIKNRINSYKNKVLLIKKELEIKQKLEEKLNEIDSELTRQSKEYLLITEKINQKQNALSDEILNIKDKIAFLGHNNQIVKLINDEIKVITSSFDIYTNQSYQNALKKYLDLCNKIKNSLTDELYNLKNKIANQKIKISEITEELTKLKANTELEIIRDDEEQKTLKYLDDHNIKYVEFYKAIEFKDGISENVKNKLESTLLSAGILNALIVLNLKDVQNLKGNFITYGQRQNNNLTKYFRPVDNLSINKDIINKVLESISTDNNEEITITENYFKASFLHIQGADNFKSIYIGILSRLKAREEQIKLVTKDKEAAEAILSNLENLKLAKEDDISKLIIEEGNFPSNDVLEQIQLDISKLTVQESMINKQKNETETKVQELTDKIEDIFKKLIDMKKEVNFPLYLETFEEILENINTLTSVISEFEIMLNDYYRYQDQILSKNEQISERNNFIDDLNASLNSINISLAKKEYERNDLDKILNSDEYKDLSAKIIELDKKIKDTQDQRLELKENYGKQAEELKHKEEELEDKVSLYKEMVENTKIKEEFFKDEYNLTYVENEKNDNTKALAKHILTKLSSRKDSDIQNVTDNYYRAYNEYRMALNDYHLVSKTIFDRETPENNILSNDVLNTLYKQNRREDLTATYQGKVLNIISLSKALTDAIEENNQIISEQDRHLFEEILLKTVGTKIRERIDSSKAWVKEINQIMKKMQEGSSLSFGLEWRSKSAEAMEELETKELVRIFQIDANMITKADSDKLINHFRSKLKRESELNSESDTYSSVIFDVLDYRNWFEFKMTYQRTGENKKELTNKVFSVFSGGEKAKTMYIPLFAAIYAKLMSANNDAPRVIALDEAFAGVDDTNIREMFGILSSLNLDYILTSQALWGDYDTVKALAIAELLRPNNAQSVCVRRYRWNGKYREIVNKRDVNDASPIF